MSKLTFTTAELIDVRDGAQAALNALADHSYHLATARDDDPLGAVYDRTIRARVELAKAIEEINNEIENRRANSVERPTVHSECRGLS